MIGIEPTGAAVEAKVLLAEGGVLAARSAPVVGTVAARRVQRTGRDADAAVEAQVAADVGAAAERVAADAGPVVGAAAQRPAAHQHLAVSSGIKSQLAYQHTCAMCVWPES